jgi:hypothetical protein
VLIALSYSVIIPFSLKKISEKINTVLKVFKVESILFVLFLLIWGFLIRESFLGQLSGTFKPHQVPQSYRELKGYLVSDQANGAVLWFPSTSPFSFYSQNHPAIDSSAVFGNVAPSAISSFLESAKAKQLLKKENVKYIVVPQDSEGKLFVEDRKYSEKEYQNTVKSLEKIPYLMVAKEFGKIVVFRTRQ